MIEQTASTAGLDVEKLKADMNRPEIDEAIANNNQLAERLGVRATPTFVIGSEVVSGAVDAEHLTKLVEAESLSISARK
jgi:protein-disulfide isomerase